MSAVDGWTIGHRPSIDEVVSMLAITSSDHGGGPVEAFLRSSTLRKVELDGTTGKTIDRLGREQGGALRWVDARTGTSGFAAASGEGVRALAACRVMAPTAAGKTIDPCPWNVNPASLEDHDLHCVVPGTAELCDWLLATAPDGLDQAWVEAGNSTETWLTGAESVQSRLRGRAWACWMPRESRRHGARPLFLAARSWSALKRMDPAKPWQDRIARNGAPKAWPIDARLVFSPETSAFLVLLLARVAHHPRATEGARVGPGWVLSTNRPGGLFGTVADDAGFPAEERLLADGREVVGLWGGQGQLRRGSYRDAPESTPVPLVLEPPTLDPPRRAVLVTRVDVHPAGLSWLVQLHGRRYPDGAAFEPHWTRLKPQLLLQACLGGVGAAMESHNGVTTPALVFDPFLPLTLG